MIRAVIFDFDGTIIDSETPDYQSWREVYQSYGLDLDLKRWARDIGRGPGDIPFNPIMDLQERLGESLDVDDLRKQRRRRFYEMMAQQGVRPGVADWLEEASRRNLTLAVASSANAEWVHGSLARLGLTHHFVSILSSADVAKAKPDPELYLKTLDILGVSPAEAIAIEDSPNGILAATRAGIFCLAVPNSLTMHLDLGPADLVAGSLSEIHLGTILSRLNSTL